MSFGGGHGTNQPSTSINNAAPGTPTGLTVDLGVVFSQPVCQVDAGAGMSAGVVTLEGSLDNLTFYPVGATPALSAPGTYVATGTVPARYLRARVTTATVGGNVTAKIGAGA